MKQNQEQKNIINHDCDEITRTRGGPDKGKYNFLSSLPTCLAIGSSRIQNCSHTFLLMQHTYGITKFDFWDYFWTEFFNNFGRFGGDF